MPGTLSIGNSSPRTSKEFCQSIKASFRMLPGRRLRILFLKNNLTPAAIQCHFSNQQFVMPFDFDLPEELARYLGIESYRIHTGVYRVKEDHEYIMIDV